MRAQLAQPLMLMAMLTTMACGDSEPSPEELKTSVVFGLDTLVAESVADRPAGAAAHTERLSPTSRVLC